MSQHAAVHDDSESDRSDSGGMGPIRACVADSMAEYFRCLNGYECTDLYRMVLAEVEVPLLESVLRYCGGNQTKAARILGLNRGTLRKKLQQYDIES